MKKIQRSFLIMVVIMGMTYSSLIIPTFAQDDQYTQEDDNFKITIRNTLLEFTPKGIQIGSNFIEDSTGFVRLLRDGGIKYKISPQAYIDEENILITEMPIQNNIIGDKKFVAYNMLVPFEFDVIFYTNYDELTTFPEGTPTQEQDSNLLLGILYNCVNVVAGAKQVNGYESGSYDTAGLRVVSNIDRFWEGAKVNNHVHQRTFDSVTHGDDNQEDRRSTSSILAYGSYTAQKPVGGSVRNGYTTARNQIMSRNDPDAITPVFTMSVNPRAIIATGTVNQDGDLNRQLESIWYEVSSIEPLADYNTKGFVESTNMVQTPRFNINTGDADVGGDGGFTTGSTKGNNQIGQVQSKIDIEIQPDGSIGKGGKYALPTTTELIDPETSKNIKELKTDLSVSLQNKSQWDVRFENVGLQPQVVLYKSTAYLYYGEYFLDSRGNSYSFSRSTKEASFTNLGGWQIRNTFVHQRYRAWVEIVSQFSSTIQQPTDAGEQSKLSEDDLDERASYLTWDADNFDETITSTSTDKSILQQWGDSIGQWWDDLGTNWNGFWDDLFGDGAAPWINLIIILGIVALSIFLVYTFAQKKIASSFGIDPKMMASFGAAGGGAPINIYTGQPTSQLRSPPPSYPQRYMGEESPFYQEPQPMRYTPPPPPPPQSFPQQPIFGGFGQQPMQQPIQPQPQQRLNYKQILDSMTPNEREQFIAYLFGVKP